MFGNNSPHLSLSVATQLYSDPVVPQLPTASPTDAATVRIRIVNTCKNAAMVEDRLTLSLREKATCFLGSDTYMAIIQAVDGAGNELTIQSAELDESTWPKDGVLLRLVVRAGRCSNCFHVLWHFSRASP